MAAEAEEAGAPMITRNIAQFLGKIKDSDRTRGHMEVYPGDVLVVDEASAGRPPRTWAGSWRWPAGAAPW